MLYKKFLSLFLLSYILYFNCLEANICSNLLSYNNSKEILSKQEKSIRSRLQAEPEKIYLETRKAAIKIIKNEEDKNFKYLIFAPTLKLIVKDLKNRLNDNDVANHREAFQGLINKGEILIKEGVPYADSIRFTLEYTLALDGVFLERHPHLNGEFHRGNAEHALEKIISRAPDILLLPSFQSVGFSYFNASRVAPLHLIGLYPSGLREGEPVPFADGFDMKPSEFSWHDIGHIEYMANRDFSYLDITFKPIERVVQEWGLTKRRIEKFHKTFRGNNKNIYDAITLLLFEILHERGYQYSLSVLKTQLETEKWTEILHRKLDNGYYKRFTWLNFDMFAELNIARKLLLKFLLKLRLEDQRNHAKAMHASSLDVRITHAPSIQLKKSKLSQFIINKRGIFIKLKNEDEVKVDFAILAQINPIENSPLDVAQKKLLSMARNAIVKETVLNMKCESVKIAKVIINSDFSITIELQDGRLVEINEVTFKDKGPSQNLILEREFFEIEQLMTLMAENKEAHYTVEPKEKVYFGRILEFGDKEIRIQSSNGVLELLSSEVLIDPMQKVDFDLLYSD